MEIKLDKDAEKKLVASIQRYISENLDTDIGELQSSLFLQFCIEEIGPSIYNQAILMPKRTCRKRHWTLRIPVLLRNQLIGLNRTKSLHNATK